MSASLELALASQVFLWVIVAAVFLASGQASIFHPLAHYLGFHAIVFVVRPLLVHYLGFDTIWGFMSFFPTENDFIKTLLVTSTALVVFAGASLWMGRSSTVFAQRNREITAVQWKALILTTAILCPLIAFSIYRSNTGGFQGEIRGDRFVMTGDSGYLMEAQFMAMPLVCVWLTVTRFRWQGCVPLALYIGYRAYWGRERWTLILFFVAVAMAYCWEHRRKWLPWWLVLLAIPVFLLFNALGQRRGLVRAWFNGEPISEWMTTDETANLPARDRYRVKYDTCDFANFDYLTFVVAVVPRMNGTYTYGAQYLQLFTEPIPRKLWPGKPLGAPVRTVNLSQYGNFFGFTVSVPGDAWMSGGWVGLIITVGLFGWLWGRFHRWFWANIDRPLCAMIYLIALALSPQQFRDGGIISMAKFSLWNLSPLILWAGLSWLMGSRLVPAESRLLPRGVRLRFRTPVAFGPRPVPTVPGSHPGPQGVTST